MAHEKIVRCDRDGINYCASLLRDNKLVAFPTETVYGLGANAFNEAAVLAIFEAKGRPLTDPLIVHVDAYSKALQLLELGNTENENSEEYIIFHELATTYWPGPLTIISKANNSIPLAVTAGTGFVGVRIPDHPIALALLKATDLPIAAPSANRFGHVSPTRAVHVIDDLGDKSIHVLDSNFDGNSTNNTACKHGIESTVIKINKELKQINIFRQGAITQYSLENILMSMKSKLANNWIVNVVSRTVAMHSLSEETKIISTVGQEAPGQAITHYSPDIACVIVSSVSFSDAVDGSSSHPNIVVVDENELKNMVVIDYGNNLEMLSNFVSSYKNLSRDFDPSEGARNLFDTLRWSEAVVGATTVMLPQINAGNDGNEKDSIVLGLIDRVYRAASGKVVELIVKRCKY